MTLSVSPEVRELLSDEQIAAVAVQVETGEAPCLRCGERIDPGLSEASVVLMVDPRPRRAAVRVSHTGCGPSIVAEAELPGPADARLAERWAAFVLPGVPLVVLQADAAVWTGEERPALIGMLRELGFEGARESFDSDLFATGVGAPGRAEGLELVVSDADLLVRLAGGEDLEVLPGIVEGAWGALARERRGALLAIGPSLGLPTEGSVAFDGLLTVLLDRAVAAWVPLA